MAQAKTDLTTQRVCAPEARPLVIERRSEFVIHVSNASASPPSVPSSFLAD